MRLIIRLMTRRMVNCKKYRKLENNEENEIFGGRLGEYKNHDMDVVNASVLDKCIEDIERERRLV